MKKTLIALMALAGVAFGETPITFNTGEFNWSLDYTLDSLGYTNGDAFTLTFKVDSYNYNNGLILTMNSGYHMVGYKVSSDTAYAGLTSNGSVASGIYGADGAEIKTQSFATPSNQDATTKTITWDSNSGEYVYTWFTTDVDKNTHQGCQKYIKDATITVSSDGTNSCVTLAIANGPKTVANLNGVVLNANDIVLGSLVTSASGTLSVGGGQAVAIIPEPATATLSLLALAGLAARRRRK